MTIDEAIVGLEDLLVDDPHFDPERRREAVKLGIEALKRIKSQYDPDHQMMRQPLSGETID